MRSSVKAFGCLLWLTVGSLVAAAPAAQTAPIAPTASVTTADGVDPLATGRRIYREGILPSGQPVLGLGPANVTLSGAQAACATCHRRSGYGSSEGPIEVRSITGPALFGGELALPSPQRVDSVAGTAATEGRSLAETARANASALLNARMAAFAGTRPRPAYDEARLARAIREGVDVSGSKMNPSMPRYALDPAALESLGAYLKTLSVQASPGVTEDKIHFATVIQPGVDPAQRAALLEVLQTYMRDRNLSMRVEVRREEAGMVRLKRSYREWVLHAWDLSGTADTWSRQLEAYARQQPVFALVSGLGAASWRPIHEFSERFELPCVLPQAEVPVLAEGDFFYTVYLSKGIALEAQALAKYLQDAGERGPVVQVYRRTDASTAAADAFRSAWVAGAAPLDQVLDDIPGEAFWQRLAHQTPGATVVLWLPPQDLAEAQALTSPGSQVKVVYLSASLNADRRAGLAADGGGRVRMVYPQDLPAPREARLELAKRWLNQKGIALTHEKLQMNAYLAATVTGMVVSHSMDTYSREFLLERLEHRLGTAHEVSIYPHLSLGPGQRYASKGSYIVRVGGADDRQLQAVSDWIVP